MDFGTKPQRKHVEIKKETHDKLASLKSMYDAQQAAEYGSKAKKVSFAAIIHNLVEMKLREETKRMIGS